MGTIFALSHFASKRLPEEEKGPAQPANSRPFQPSSSSTVRTFLLAFFLIGLIYIPIGISLYISSNNIRDFEVDYTGVEASSPCYSSAKNLMWNSTRLCRCTVTFSLDQSVTMSSCTMAYPTSTRATDVM